MKISVIIATLNRKNALKNLLKQLKKEDCEIVVVDDGSTDGTKKMVKRFQDVKYIEGEGIGQQPALMKGVKNCDGDVVCFLDDDVEVEEGFLEPIRKDFENGEKVVQSKLVFLDRGEKNIQKERKKIGKFKWNLRRHSNFNWGTKKRYVDFCSECGVFIKKEILEEISFYDSNLKGNGYGASLSFSLRIKEKNIKILFNPKSVVKHVGTKGGGAQERYNKKRNQYCSEFSKTVIANLTYLNKRFNKRRLGFVKMYFFIAGLYLSLKNRKNCLKYYTEGMKTGEKI